MRTTSGLSLALACLKRWRPTASVFLSRSPTGSLATSARRTWSALAAYDAIGFLGSFPESSLAPSLTQRSILAIAAADKRRVRPLGHARLDLALDPQDERAFVRISRRDDFVVGSSL